MRTATLIVCLLAGSTSMGSAIEEVNQWRAKYGLKPFAESPELTRFAQQKAEWRAARLAQNGHQGPPCPAGCREGCGEATPQWGWLTCCQEETGDVAGAGVAIGADGQRYMVLVVRGVNGSAPKGRSLRPFNTSGLTPDAPVIPRLRR